MHQIIPKITYIYLILAYLKYIKINKGNILNLKQVKNLLAQQDMQVSIHIKEKNKVEETTWNQLDIV